MTSGERNNKLSVHKGWPAHLHHRATFLGHSSRKPIQAGSGELQKTRRNAAYLNKEVRPGHTWVTCWWVVQWRFSLELCQVMIYREIEQQSFPTISKSSSTDTFIKTKKVLFLSHLFHFANWYQQSLWSPCKCLLAPHPREQWTLLWGWFINADQQQWLKLFF